MQRDEKDQHMAGATGDAFAERLRLWVLEELCDTFQGIVIINYNC